MANPTSESELQLYRVLQRANLLQYFETFISQGGDDVQQLCEAGEEEFLEIMALVGMASKPLHVRRLQKVLQEWVTSPAVFHQPLGPHTPPPPIAPGSILASVQRPYLKMGQTGAPITKTSTSMANWNSQADQTGDVQVAGGHGTTAGSLSPVSISVMDTGIYSDNVMMGMNGLLASNMGQQHQMAYPVDSPESGNGTLAVDERGNMVSPGSPPQLTEGQLAAIERAAEELAKTLPQYEPKPLNAKKLINKEIEEVMKLPTDHPERMDLLRKYGCIYGRFDSRRKNEKHLSLHEISVNEASAQLCKHRVSLLTRRDDLFPLSRQVVRDSGYQYSKGHSRGQTVEIPPNKKQRNMRMAEINRELTTITMHQQTLKRQILHTPGDENTPEVIVAQNELQGLMARQLQLLTEQSDIVRKQRNNRRSQYRQSLKTQSGADVGTKEEDQDDDDDDSIPFPTESFANSGTEEDFFGSSHSKVPGAEDKDYSQYDERLRMMQGYAMDDYTKGAKIDDRQIVIKQEVCAEEVENSIREDGLEPGEVQLSWPIKGRLFGQQTTAGQRRSAEKRMFGVVGDGDNIDECNDSSSSVANKKSKDSAESQGIQQSSDKMMDCENDPNNVESGKES